MGNEAELQKIVVRLSGDGTSYTTMTKEAAAATERDFSKMDTKISSYEDHMSGMFKRLLSDSKDAAAGINHDLETLAANMQDSHAMMVRSVAAYRNSLEETTDITRKQRFEQDRLAVSSERLSRAVEDNYVAYGKAYLKQKDMVGQMDKMHTAAILNQVTIDMQARSVDKLNKEHKSLSESELSTSAMTEHLTIALRDQFSVLTTMPKEAKVSWDALVNGVKMGMVVMAAGAAAAGLYAASPVIAVTALGAAAVTGVAGKSWYDAEMDNVKQGKKAARIKQSGDLLRAKLAPGEEFLEQPRMSAETAGMNGFQQQQYALRRGQEQRGIDDTNGGQRQMDELKAHHKTIRDVNDESKRGNTITTLQSQLHEGLRTSLMDENEKVRDLLATEMRKQGVDEKSITTYGLKVKATQELTKKNREQLVSVEQLAASNEAFIQSSRVGMNAIKQDLEEYAALLRKAGIPSDLAAGMLGNRRQGHIDRGNRDLGNQFSDIVEGGRQAKEQAGMTGPERQQYAASQVLGKRTDLSKQEKELMLALVRLTAEQTQDIEKSTQAAQSLLHAQKDMEFVQKGLVERWKEVDYTVAKAYKEIDKITEKSKEWRDAEKAKTEQLIRGNDALSKAERLSMENDPVKRYKEAVSELQKIQNKVTPEVFAKAMQKAKSDLLNSGGLNLSVAIKFDTQAIRKGSAEFYGMLDQVAFEQARGKAMQAIDGKAPPPTLSMAQKHIQSLRNLAGEGRGKLADPAGAARAGIPGAKDRFERETGRKFNGGDPADQVEMDAIKDTMVAENRGRMGGRRGQSPMAKRAIEAAVRAREAAGRLGAEAVDAAKEREAARNEGKPGEGGLAGQEGDKGLLTRIAVAVEKMSEKNTVTIEPANLEGV